MFSYCHFIGIFKGSREKKIKGAGVNVYCQSGIFNWKTLLFFAFFQGRREDTFEIWHAFVSGEVGDGRYVRQMKLIFKKLSLFY